MAVLKDIKESIDMMNITQKHLGSTQCLWYLRYLVIITMFPWFNYIYTCKIKRFFKIYYRKLKIAWSVNKRQAECNWQT